VSSEQFKIATVISLHRVQSIVSSIETICKQKNQIFS
jgi:hypothetical protein